MSGKSREGGPLRVTLSTGQGWMQMETYLLDSATGPLVTVTVSQVDGSVDGGGS